MPKRWAIYFTAALLAASSLAGEPVQSPYQLSSQLDGTSMEAEHFNGLDISHETQSLGPWLHQQTFVPINQLKINRFHPPQRLLYRMTLHNPKTTTERFFITYEAFVPKSIKLYSSQFSMIAQGGYRHPFNDWTYPYRFPTFEITVEPGTHDYYIEFETTILNPRSIRTWGARNFQDHLIWGYGYCGALVGTMLVMTLYNLILYFANRKSMYLIYVCFTGSWFLGELVVKGLLFQMFD